MEQLDLDMQDNTDPGVEAKARALDWVPKDEWRGNPEFWKPAQEYLDYAESVMPVLKQNNKKLFADLQQRDHVVQTLQQTVNEQAKILKVLTESANDNAISQVDDKISNLREQLVQANRDGDAEAATAIQEELMDLKLELREAKAAPTIDPTKGQSQQPAMSPEDRATWNDWTNANSWFKDPVLAAAASVMGSEIIRENLSQGFDAPKGRVLLDEITKRMDNKFNVSNGKHDDKVDGGSNTSSTITSKGTKRYNSLPIAAKEVCDSQAKKFVGPGKRYAKLEEWQKRFTEIYYSDEA